MSEAFYNMGIAMVQSGRRDEGISLLLQARKMFSQEGKTNKFTEVDQYVQKLAEQPTTIPPVIQPTLPARTQDQPSNLPQQPSERQTQPSNSPLQPSSIPFQPLNSPFRLNTLPTPPNPAAG
jgi:hypothetical protein